MRARSPTSRAIPEPFWTTSCYGPFAGHSVSLHKRISYIAWLAGANYLLYEHRGVLVMNENAVRELYGYPPDKAHDRTVLSPLGEVASNLFRLVKEKDRGVPCTPVALMVDHAHGWSPSGCTPHLIWARLPLKKGDHMLDEFFNTIYPWNPKRDYGQSWAQNTLPSRREQGYVVNGPFGEIFDVFTNKSCRTLDGYRVLMLVGDVRVDATLAARLTQYVRGGGTLVVNAQQVGSHLAAGFLGAELTGQNATAEAARCKLDREKLAGAAFEYAKVRLTSARPLVVVDGGDDVLVCANKVGQGQVILTTPAYLLDRDSRALPLLTHLLDHLTSGLLPVRVSSGVQYLVNKTVDGWVVGLINNKGVYKKPIGPPDVRPEEAMGVTVEFDGAAAAAREWLTDTALSFKKRGGKTIVTLTVPAGDVRIVELRTR